MLLVRSDYSLNSYKSRYRVPYNVYYGCSYIYYCTVVAIIATIIYIGQSSIPNSVPTVNTTNGIEIHWDPVQLKDCANNYTTVTYTVRVTRADGQEEGRVVLSGETSESALIHDLKPMLEYAVSITALAVTKTTFGSYTCELGTYPTLKFSTPSTSGSAALGQQCKFDYHL